LGKKKKKIAKKKVSGKKGTKGRLLGKYGGVYVEVVNQKTPS